MKKDIIYYLIVLILLTACSSSNDNNFSQNSVNNVGDNANDGSTGGGDNNGDGFDNLLPTDWLIPINDIVDAGPGPDGIPSIDNPQFVKTFEPAANYLEPDDLVVGIVVGNVARAYPHKILDWHEIVNDYISNKLISISYCPLTGTGFAWEGESSEIPTAFGVSGLLYNGNLILYDRTTQSYWSQLKLQCVSGISIGEEPSLINIVETNWATWKANYPQTKVLSLNTGFIRDYATYPYGSYRTDHDFLIYPVSQLDTQLPSKERVHAIIDNGTIKAYRLSTFENGNLINETFNGNDYLIVGNNNLINSFELIEEHANLDFELQLDGLQVFFTDNEGNKWNILGKAIEGPRTGEKLTASKSVMSYWFAIAAFYPNPEIYTE